MTDNVAVTAGSGTTIATDDVSGAHYQRVKLTDGTADATTVVAAGSGVQANALRVVLPSDASDVKVTLDSEAVVLGAGSAAVGKLAVNSGVDIGDVDVLTCGTITPGTAAANLGKAEDAGHSTGDVGVMTLAVRQDAMGTPLAGANADYIPLITDALGALWTRTAENGKTRISARVALTASQTGTAVWTPTSGKKFVLRKLVVNCKTAGDIQFFDATDSGNTVIGPILAMPNTATEFFEWDADMPYRSAAVNNVLKYTTGSGFAGSAYVEGWEE